MAYMLVYDKKQVPHGTFFISLLRLLNTKCESVNHLLCRWRDDAFCKEKHPSNIIGLSKSLLESEDAEYGSKV